MPGVGNQTRREIAMAVRILRERPGQPQREDITTVREDVVTFEVRDTEATLEPVDVGNLSVDLLVQRVIRSGSETERPLDASCTRCWDSIPNLMISGRVSPRLPRVLDVTRAPSRAVGGQVPESLVKGTRDHQAAG